MHIMKAHEDPSLALVDTIEEGSKKHKGIMQIMVKVRELKEQYNAPTLEQLDLIECLMIPELDFGKGRTVKRGISRTAKRHICGNLLGATPIRFSNLFIFCCCVFFAIDCFLLGGYCRP